MLQNIFMLWYRQRKTRCSTFVASHTCTACFLYSAFFSNAVGCQPAKTKKRVETAKTDTYYTCSMHPQIMQEKPGTCPICHMELIPVNKIK